MLILGVDTSGKNGNIALVQFEQGSPRTLEVIPLEGGTFSAQLIPQISDLLARHNCSKSDIDGFAVVSGPGSFTGLRVGLAAIKALADVLRKPIAAISLLEAVAKTSAKPGEILAVLDAGRGEVYVACCDVSDRQVTIGEERLLAVAELFATSKDRDVATPDPKLANLVIERGVRVTLIPYPRADVIARMGFEKIKAGEVISVEALDANYIRRSDAEMKLPGK